MEHASIAAFARLTLQLLALGAPPDLVVGAQQAMADETKHARLAFGLASAYGACEIGPGPIAIDGCLEDTEVASLIATTFAEGCIGETIAALEALEAHQYTRDPTLRAVLETIASDEARHAEHAWRMVKWTLDAFGRRAREQLCAELARAHSEVNADAVDRRNVRPDEFLAHGILNNDLRAKLRREVLRELVVPLATELLGDRTRRAEGLSAVAEARAS